MLHTWSIFPFFKIFLYLILACKQSIPFTIKFLFARFRVYFVISLEKSEIMDLNTILAFNQLVLNKTESEKVELAKLHGIDLNEYNLRIRGKEKEAEFLLILKSMGCLKHLEAYDEGVSHITGEYTPDFQVELSDGYKMMVEVKHTDKDVYHISSGNLLRRIEFANRHKLPLRFAVSIKGLWGLFTTDSLVAKGGKLTISDFTGEKSVSWWDQELETCSYMFPKNLKIRSVYSNNHKKAMDISFPPYGQLVSYELYCDDRKVFRMKGTNSQYLSYVFYLEALQNRLANSKQIIVQNEYVTVITDFSDDESFCIIPEYEFLIAPLGHLYKRVDGDMVRYTPQSAVAEKNFIHPDKLMLRFIISDLVAKGMNIQVFKDSIGYRFEDYRARYWVK